jgi:hypothetical protein
MQAHETRTCIRIPWAGRRPAPAPSGTRAAAPPAQCTWGVLRRTHVHHPPPPPPLPLPCSTDSLSYLVASKGLPFQATQGPPHTSQMAHLTPFTTAQINGSNQIHQLPRSSHCHGSYRLSQHTPLRRPTSPPAPPCCSRPPPPGSAPRRTLRPTPAPAGVTRCHKARCPVTRHAALSRAAPAASCTAPQPAAGDRRSSHHRQH